MILPRIRRWLTPRISPIYRQPNLKRVRDAYANLALPGAGAVPDAQRRCAERRFKTAVEEFVEDRLPLGEYVRELAVLGLKGKPYHAEAYADALKTFLDYPIRLTRISIEGDQHFIGRTEYEPATGGVVIRIPARIDWWLYQYTLFHEAAHLAAGHRFEQRDESTRSVILRHSPRKKLARVPPISHGLPEDLLKAIYEAEAELRAEYATLTSSLGEQVFETGRLNQVS